MAGDQDIPSAPSLPGEAPNGKYSFRSGDGVPVNPSYTIFPIIRYDPQGRPQLLGTGFFISIYGLFATARHVLLDPFDSNGRQKYPIELFQLLPENIWIRRPILRCAWHHVADVAVGVAAPMTHNPTGQPLTNPIVTLSQVRLERGVRVMTYAYPKHASVALSNGSQAINFMPTCYDGDVAEYFPSGRDRVMLPAPCYQTTIAIHSGASGGPVFSPSGHVFGVNSTGFNGTDVSFVSRINEILNLVVEGVVMGGGAPRAILISDIAKAGHIKIWPHL